MSSSLAEPSTTPTLVPGKKYRFFARSAEEAVQVIHDRMGPSARVVAVEQVSHQGIGRLLRGPRLEVIAMIPPSEEPSAPEAPPTPTAEEPAPPPPRAPRPRPRRPASQAHLPPRQDAPVPRAQPAGPAVPSAAPQEFPPSSMPETGRPAYTPTGRPPRAEPEPALAESGISADRAAFEREVAAPRSSASHRDVRSILHRLGFGQDLLEDFVAEIDPRGLGRASWTEKLELFFEFLWRRYRQLPNRPMTDRVAFFGTPGSGITTALCKELTASVFLRGEQPLVACLEHETASSHESLRAYCELMQVPLVTEERGAMAPSERVFWDIPGISSRDFDTWNEVGARLDELLIQTRVFVTHAAFDTQHLVQLLRTVETVRPTHLVLTHLDEATQPARLWDFLQSAGLCPLFAADGPSVTGDRRDDFHAALLEHTFPSHLNTAKTESNR